MKKLSHKEAYVLDLLNSEENIQNLTNLSDNLLGLFAHAFIDDLEKIPGFSFDVPHKKIHNIVEDLFINPEMIFAKTDAFMQTLVSLNQSNILEMKKTDIFGSFSSLKIETLKSHTEPQTDSYADVIEILNDNLSRFFKKYQKEKSKFEIRYFWPEDSVAEVYDCWGQLFETNAYDHKTDKDEYLINGNLINIKRRNDQFQIKELLQEICYISRYSNKKKVKSPIQSSVLEQLGYQPIEVVKERYVRKFEEKTKAEFSRIRLNGKEWKTICIESKSFQTVFALSSLINPENAERLTYPQFLNKYGLFSEKLPSQPQIPAQSQELTREVA